MKEQYMGERATLPPQREALYKTAESELRYTPQLYRLGDRFEGLTPAVADVHVLDVTEIPGCHYAAKNVFVPIIHHLEQNGSSVGRTPVAVSPDKTILVEPSTGNGWVAFSDAAEKLGYEHRIIMPDGLPEARYRHPSGRPVEILKTPKEDYAMGMPKALMTLLMQNRGRLASGEKTYVTPNHAVTAADITIKEMSVLGQQILLGDHDPYQPLTVVASMGNGASVCAIGEYIKQHSDNARVIATESFAYGGGYNKFADLKGLPSYKDLYGIEPGTKELMDTFTAYGTNAPIGIELPLQTRAMRGDLIDEYVLFTDNDALGAYDSLAVRSEQRWNAGQLPNYSMLPKALIDTFGNSSLANIAVAALAPGHNVAMAYDSRRNY